MNLELGDLNDLRTIRNNLAIPQSIVFEGQQVVLAPYAQENMDGALAASFLELCPLAVTEVKAAKLPAEMLAASGQNAVWLANMTGNPLEPEKIKAQVWKTDGKKTRLVWEEIENPRRKAAIQRLSYDPGQLPGVGRAGEYISFNLAPIPVELGIRDRQPLPSDIATWFLMRTNTDPVGVGSVIKSRAPSMFEPDSKWPLNDIRQFARMISSNLCALGPDEETLATKAKKDKDTPEKFNASLREAKRALLANLFYYVANPAYRLPTQDEFMELKTGKSRKQLEADEAMEMLRKAEASLSA